jgi:cyclic pyranopterin phosphate synthase
MGITRLRITGGEPLLRTDVETLVRMLAAIPGISDLAMSTNGTLLAAHAAALASAGLRRVNVSLDAIDAARYAAITGGGDVRSVLEGIEAARLAGLAPVKLNCVVRRSSSEPDAKEVADFARRKGLPVRFIQEMDLSAGRFGVVEGAAGGDCTRCSRLRLLCDGVVKPCLFSDLGFSVRAMGPASALAEAMRRKPRTGKRCTRERMHAIGG